MKLLRSLAMAATLLCAMPAAADVTGRYVATDGSGRRVTIEVNAQGDSHIMLPSSSEVLTIGGTSYLIDRDEQGPFAVRWSDLIEVTAEVGSRAPNSPAQPERHFGAAPRSMETVGGRTGTLWAIRERGKEDEPGHENDAGFNIVVSDDPALAPLGRAMAAYLIQTLELASHGEPAGRNPPVDVVRAILQHGTVLRVSGVLRLVSVETGPIPASEFRLALAPLTRDQAQRRMLGGTPPRAVHIPEGHRSVPCSPACQQVSPE